MTRFGLSVLAIVCATAAVPAAAVAARATDVPDGWVDRSEVCLGGPDMLGQPPLYRPHGGVLLAPSSLTVAQKGVLGEAVRLRFEATSGKAVWRVVYDEGSGFELPGDEDGVLFASCQMGDAGSLKYWRWAKVAGGLGLVWSAIPTEAQQIAAVAGALHGLEGVPPE